jgi:drug/metabolite transporter (DMT)-like permease
VLAALLTAVLWSLSSASGSRASRILGGPATNFYRLLIALVILSTIIAGMRLLLPGQRGLPLVPSGAAWFILSGAIGMGIGDLALYSAYERIGVRLPALITHCGAIPAAALLEGCWLGGHVSPRQGLLALIILLGIVIALAPGLKLAGTPSQRRSGLALAACSALGLACSAVISRKAYSLATLHPVHCIDAACLRTLGALALLAAVFSVDRWLHWPADGDRLRTWVPGRRLTSAAQASPATGPAPAPEPTRKGLDWLAISAICGPTTGVATYQWALSTGRAASVQAVVAVVPILVMPLAWWWEGDRPTPWALVGGAIAVSGAILLSCTPV